MAGSLCSRNARGRSELAAWSPPVLAEAAHADGAPSMRAVGGDQAALARKGVERKIKKALATGKGRVLARPGWAGEKEVFLTILRGNMHEA